MSHPILPAILVAGPELLAAERASEEAVIRGAKFIIAVTEQRRQKNLPLDTACDETIQASQALTSAVIAHAAYLRSHQAYATMLPLGYGLDCPCSTEEKRERGSLTVVSDAVAA